MSKAHNHGLTLAELLIAMSVGALVLLLLGQGLNNMSKWSGQLISLQKQSEKTISLFRFINERLIRIKPLSIETEEGTRVLFAGSAQQITMVIAETDYPAKPGLYEQSLFIQPGEDQNWQVFLTRKPLFRLDEFASTATNTSVLIYSGPLQPSFSFLGQNGWQEQWDAPEQMPLQIGFELQNYPKITIALPPAQPPFAAPKPSSNQKQPKTNGS